jgi:hypothetical protein
MITVKRTLYAKYLRAPDTLQKEENGRGKEEWARKEWAVSVSAVAGPSSAHCPTKAGRPAMFPFLTANEGRRYFAASALRIFLLAR